MRAGVTLVHGRARRPAATLCAQEWRLELGSGADARRGAVDDGGDVRAALRHARQAGAAYRQWGKGFHPAGLNFGDCFAYALAKEQNCPLLFIGNDFSRTDIKPARDAEAGTG